MTLVEEPLHCMRHGSLLLNYSIWTKKKKWLGNSHYINDLLSQWGFASYSWPQFKCLPSFSLECLIPFKKKKKNHKMAYSCVNKSLVDKHIITNMLLLYFVCAHMCVTHTFCPPKLKFWFYPINIYYLVTGLKLGPDQDNCV